MDALGDCPQFVSMVNSAVQNLLTAKAISNEGHAEYFQTIVFLFSLNLFPPDLTKSLTTLKDAHVLFSASSDRIASFSSKEWDNWFRAVTKVPEKIKNVL